MVWKEILFLLVQKKSLLFIKEVIYSLSNKVLKEWNSLTKYLNIEWNSLTKFSNTTSFYIYIYIYIEREILFYDKQYTFHGKKIIN